MQCWVAETFSFKPTEIAKFLIVAAETLRVLSTFFLHVRAIATTAAAFTFNHLTTTYTFNHRTATFTFNHLFSCQGRKLLFILPKAFIHVINITGIVFLTLQLNNVKRSLHPSLEKLAVQAIQLANGALSHVTQHII